jgi:hypothetical protein
VGSRLAMALSNGQARNMIFDHLDDLHIFSSQFEIDYPTCLFHEIANICTSHLGFDF